MADFLISLISNHAPILISTLALAVSLASFFISWRSYALNKRSKLELDRLTLFEKRSAVLGEVDKQYARMGSLIAIIAEKIILFEENKWLVTRYPNEYQRLRNNLNSVESLRSNYERQRELAERVKERMDTHEQEKVLAEIKRLSLHIDEDILKEERHLNSIKEKLRLISNESI